MTQVRRRLTCTPRSARSSLRPVTDKPPGKPRWQFTSEEWRLLVITFVGGLGSIVIGAVLIGIAIALSRAMTNGPHTNKPHVLWVLAVATVFFCGATWLSVRKALRERWTSPFRLTMLGALILVTTSFVLAWIGLAVGIH